MGYIGILTYMLLNLHDFQHAGSAFGVHLLRDCDRAFVASRYRFPVVSLEIQWGCRCAVLRHAVQSDRRSKCNPPKAPSLGAGAFITDRFPSDRARLILRYGTLIVPPYRAIVVSVRRNRSETWPASWRRKERRSGKEEFRLAERKKKLAEREAEERAAAIGKSVLGKLDQARLDALLGRMKSLGIEEVEKRLSGVNHTPDWLPWAFFAVKANEERR